MNKDKNLTGHEKDEFPQGHQQHQSGGDTGQQHGSDAVKKPGHDRPKDNKPRPDKD
jgi:hypothetical protein